MAHLFSKFLGCRHIIISDRCWCRHLAHLFLGFVAFSVKFPLKENLSDCQSFTKLHFPLTSPSPEIGQQLLLKIIHQNSCYSASWRSSQSSCCVWKIMLSAALLQTTLQLKSGFWISPTADCWDPLLFAAAHVASTPGAEAFNEAVWCKLWWCWWWQKAKNTPTLQILTHCAQLGAL